MSEHDKPAPTQQNPLTPKPALVPEPRSPFPPSPLLAPPPLSNPFGLPSFGFHQPAPVIQPPLQQPAANPQVARPSLFSSLGLFDWFGSFGHPMATVTPQAPIQTIAGTDQAAQSNQLTTSPTIATPTATKTEAKPGAAPKTAPIKDEQTARRSAAA